MKAFFFRRILVLFLWVSVLVLAVSVFKKKDRSDEISTYFDRVEKEQPEKPQHLEQWEREDGHAYLSLIPGHEQIFDGFAVRLPPTRVKINSDGFRDREYPPKKPPNTFRIIMLGDSIAFGWGVELEESIPKRLEYILNSERRRQTVEVLNFGVPDHNTRQEVEMFKDKGLKYEPDLLVVVFLKNDFEDDLFKRQLKTQIVKEYEEKGASSDNLAMDLHREILKRMESRLRNMPFREAWNIVGKPIEELVSLARKRNINILIYLFSELDMEQETAFDNMADAHENLYLKRSEVGIAASEEKLILHPLDEHPNPLGCSRYAQEIYEALLKNDLVPSH